MDLMIPNPHPTVPLACMSWRLAFTTSYLEFSCSLEKALPSPGEGLEISGLSPVRAKLGKAREGKVPEWILV